MMVEDMLKLDDLNDSINNERRGGHVNLKGHGIAIDDLISGGGTDFEIDEESVHNADDGKYFDNEELFKQLNYECIDDEGDSGDEKITPFEKMKRDMEDVTEDGGVKKKILKSGAGSKVNPNSLCRVHYNAYLEYSDEPFDSSRLRGRQQQFKLGGGEVLLGWEYAIPTMKRGETSRFLFQPQYAYGKMGIPPRIPEKADVMFEIELISFVDQGASDSFANFTDVERKEASFDHILKVADVLRSTGNEAFKLNQIGRAAGKYSEALRLLENASLPGEEEEMLMKKSALKLHLNLSLCNLKLTKSGKACKHARKALDIDRTNVKAFFRLSRALRQLGDYDEAKRYINKAYKIDPGNREIKEELLKLDEEIQRTRKQDQALSKKMLNLSHGPKEKVVADKTKSSTSHLLPMFIERLKKFKEGNESEPIIFPTILTEDELTSLTNEAKDMGLITSSVMQEGKRSVKVTKPSC